MIRKLNVNWRAASMLACAYMALSLFDLMFAGALAEASFSAFEFAAFFSGPAGFLLALTTTPASWTPTTLLYYLAGTLLLALSTIFCCRRRTGFRGLAVAVFVLLWIVSGFFAGVYALAFAA